MKSTSKFHYLIIGSLLSSCLFASSNEEQANELFQAQQWQQAADAYRLLSEQQSSNGLYWFRLGQSLYNQQKHQDAIPALKQALAHQHENVPVPTLLVLLARSEGAMGDKASAMQRLEAVEAVGARPYQAVKNSTEFEAFNQDEDFLVLLEKLKPCSTPEHRGFDLWIGEWEVTSPVRPGWSAQSSITVSNDDCVINENYVSQGGYSGRSISFYDPNKKKWHQTWIDNQGAPLYLEGNPADGAMVLSNENSRVTWSVQPDNRVRQHWESTADGGQTWTTAFDGYYQKK